jgi:hypothetical protein
LVEHPASRWGDLFDQACRVIDQANSKLKLIDNWTFGGGTALMLQIDHRESFDVDIFLDDPQLLPYLNPRTQGYPLDINPDGYASDGSTTLKIVFENVGEIDFICAPSLTDNPTVKAKVRGRDVLLETPAEIITKKIYYRGAAMQPRDMFDIACVARTHGLEYLSQALTPFRDRCEAALKVARQMNPQFAETIMARLLRHAGFSDIPLLAQAMTIKLLETICTEE